MTIVFVVDDDLAVRCSLSSLLRSAGITVEVFSSAEEFLSYSGPHAPECVVLDIYMPGTTGPELMRELVDSGRPIPVLFISSHSDAKLLASPTTSAEFLRKPFADDALLAAIERLVRRAPPGVAS
jgi:FixJ family two-component response regulator